MAYGYAYLHTVPTGANAPRLEQMTMSEVRPLMCAKSHGDVKVCMDHCLGFATCQPGQRMAALITEKDKWKPVWTGKEEERPENRSQLEKEAQELLRAACGSGNAWAYLMQEKHLGKDAAGELLSRLIRKYPGIAADYGGSRRIMQRPRAVTVTRMGGEPEAHEEPPEEKTEEKPTEPVRLLGREGSIAVRAEASRIRCEEALASGDPITWMLEHGYKSRHSCTAVISQWKKRWPELFAEKEAEEPRKPTEEPDDDEISLTDFLTGYAIEEDDPETAPDSPQIAPEAPEEEIPAQSAGQAHGAENGGEMRGWLRHYEQQARRIEKMLETLTEEWRLTRERIREIEKDMRRRGIAPGEEREE